MFWYVGFSSGVCGCVCWGLINIFTTEKEREGADSRNLGWSLGYYLTVFEPVSPSTPTTTSVMGSMIFAHTVSPEDKIKQ